LNTIYRRNILDADLPVLLKGKKEVEMVDLYMRIKEQLQLYSSTDETNAEVTNRLEEHLSTILNSLPQDLQESIKKQSTINQDQNPKSDEQEELKEEMSLKDTDSLSLHQSNDNVDEVEQFYSL